MDDLKAVAFTPDSGPTDAQSNRSTDVPKVVSEILGHSQAAFTMDRYQHVTWAMQQEAANAVSALLKTSTQN